METRENEIVARALEAFWRLMSRAIELDRSGAAIDALAALEAAFKEEIAVHRTPPSSGGAVELYRKHWDDVHRAHYYKRATKAEAVIEAARKVCEDQAAIHDKSAWPQKYRAAFGAIAKLYDALDALDKE
jgi:hypothetical protein